MNPTRFHFPIVILGDDGTPERLRGNAWPITPAGDLLTCRHVVSTLVGVRLAVLDQELGRTVPVSIPDIRFPANAELDLALLPKALGRPSSFLPLLTPTDVLMGTDVNAYGPYSVGGANWNNVTHGFFSGHVIGFSGQDSDVMTISFPVIEGLSGSPAKTFHNGTKAVGLCFASESQRVLASEVLEFKEGNREVRETVHRVVEFGLAYRVEVIQAFCAELGIAPVVTSGSVDIPGLPS